MVSVLRRAIVIALGVLAPGVAGAAGDYLAALEFAVDLDDPAAQLELAVKYEHAEGVPRDLQTARALYCRSARQGDAEAQFRLGWIYANGRGIARDDDVAAALFGMAADQGHTYAAKMLRYVHKLDGTQLPSCMLPDPPRTVAVAASVEPEVSTLEGGPAAEGSDIEQLVRRLAPRYAVDPQLVLAVISVESAFNPRAVSTKNAQGLMQLMPGTAERFGVKQVFNPIDNIKGGLAYLRWLLAFFEGEVELVLAAYNSGERTVERYRGIPPYAETRAYVRKISGIYGKASHPYEPTAVEPSAVIGRMKRRQG